MIRISVAVLVAAGLASAASAALQPDDEALWKCSVDFDAAYALIVPEPAAGETEEQSLAKLSPELGKLARAVEQWSKQVHDRIALSTHLTSDDSARLGAIEKAEEDDVVNRLNGAKTDAEQDAAFGDLMTRVDNCAAKFIPHS